MAAEIALNALRRLKPQRAIPPAGQRDDVPIDQGRVRCWPELLEPDAIESRQTNLRADPKVTLGRLGDGGDCILR